MKTVTSIGLLMAVATIQANGLRQIGTMDFALVQKRHQALLGATGLPSPKSGVKLYKFTYPSRDMRGKSTTLSSLIAVPIGIEPRALIAYCHGTQTERSQSPSRFTGHNSVAEAEIAALALATGPYVVVMPDYLGHGDHKGFHPYPLSAVNANSVIDAVRAIKALPTRPFAIGKKLFVTGYSEGGAVALWTVRKMEKLAEFGHGPDYAVPMSGPYDLKDTIIDWLTSKTTDGKLFAFKVLGLAYSSLGLQKNNPRVSLKSFFVPSFATYVPKVFAEDESKIPQRLLVKAVQLGALQQVDRLLQPSFKTAMNKRDLKNPLVAAFTENSCLDWTPRTKMTMVYLPSDTVVVAQHSQRLLASFRARGVTEAQVSAVELPEAGLNHITAMSPALSVARRAFDAQ